MNIPNRSDGVCGGSLTLSDIFEDAENGGDVTLNDVFWNDENGGDESDGGLIYCKT
jgi:hypothetical protein